LRFAIEGQVGDDCRSVANQKSKPQILSHQPGAITGGQGAGNAMGLGFNEVVKQDRCGERHKSGPKQTVPSGVPSGNTTAAGPWQAKSQNLAEDGHQFKG
jgi:hypothetical protein